jgi:putative nucleotidyltransferase with HDIG domain
MSSAGISREEAVTLMENYLQAESLRKHCYASEAVMRAMAEKLGHDPELWGIVGLLHDLDYNETKDQPSQHSLKTAEILKERGVRSSRRLRLTMLKHWESNGRRI